jgi:hypothetical protein
MDSLFVISVFFIICVIVFLSYAFLAGSYFSCTEYFFNPFVIIVLK